MKYVIVAGSPCPAQLAPFLRQLLASSGAQLESCYRGADAEGLLHTLGKSSQRELYAGWVARRPGFNPANPPGFSTHELRSDGAAYPRVSRGRALAWWQCGIDIDDHHVEPFIAAARKHGWDVWQPYPAGSEYHHVNFRKQPRLAVVKSRLHRCGAAAPRVA